MYIKLPESDKKCSKCGAINQTERTERGEFPNLTVYLVCTVCGHRKIISKTTSFSDSGYFHVYNLDERPKVEEF